MAERNLTVNPLDPATENVFTSWSAVATQLGPLLATNQDMTSKFSVWSKASKAAALLARYDETTRATSAYTGTATVVLSAANAASTIASAIRVPPAYASPSYFDTDNDSNFAFPGVPAGRGAVAGSASDMLQPDLLTGGSAQAARWQHRVGFWHSGQKLGFYFRMLSAVAATYQIWVNGQPLSTTLANTGALTSGGRYHLEVDFGSVDTRLVELELDTTSVQFGGVYIEPTATVRRSPRRPKIAVLGDSISGGANGVGLYYVWPERLATLFDADYWKLSIGGTGYISGAGTNAFIDRVSDVALAAPDLLIVAGGQNDLGNTQAAVKAAAETLFAALKAANPYMLIMATGCHQVSEVVSTNQVNCEAGIKAACTTYSIPFISLIDPVQQIPNATAWAFSTAYVIGDRRSFGNNLWVCHTAHTSAASGSIDTTKWIAASMITGTGKVGTTTGRGNADVSIQSDGIHLTIPGQKTMAGVVTSGVVAALRSIVATG